MGEQAIVTAAQMRWADQQTIAAGSSADMLMDRAGRAVATAALDVMADYGRVVIVAGFGNNGGDGFAAAHYLRRRRLPVTVVTLQPVAKLSDVCRRHAERAREAGAKIREANGADGLCELDRWLLRAVLVVDAIFGTGLHRPIEGWLAEAVARINHSDRPVLSVDIASGICADRGVVMGVAVQADYTLPIAASKWGHWLLEGRDYAGELLPFAEIGIAPETIHAAYRAVGGQLPQLQRAVVIGQGCLRAAWPPRSRMAHKGSYGHVWIFGGSQGLTGAPKLAGLGAYAAGAGLATIACPEAVWPVVAAGNLDVMTQVDRRECWQQSLDQIDAVVAGPGWGAAQGALLAELLATDKPLLLDADALNTLAADAALQSQLQGRRAPTVLTPHPGEAARLLGQATADVQRDRRQAALALMDRYHCWVVLKGSETLVVSPAGEMYLNPFGSPRMAVAGSGDLLAGMIGALLARTGGGASDELGQVVAAAVALHGQAGEAQGWYLASQLAGVVAALRQAIEQQS